MRYDRVSKILIPLFVSLLAEASKCPETRKPHVTSCTIFYNCINLPEGGYVWAPAKCPQGLVFQPYLRMCVLPGDSWSCDDSASEKSPSIEPELLDPSKTSYLGQSPQDHSQLGNVRIPMTPYPLIEVEKDKVTSLPSKTFDDRIESNLHRFFQSQHKLETKLNTVLETNHGENNRYTWLRGVIDRILLFEKYEGLSSRFDACQLPPTSGYTKKDQKVETLKDMDILPYLVESYVLGTRNPVKTKLKNKKPIKGGDGKIEQKFTKINQKVDITNSENNVVIIEGNLGQRQYVTVESYKKLSNRVDVRVLGILPCARGVRLPNRTDCTKYYTCIPESATVVDFSCPPRTAFNDFKRVCDPHRFSVCSRTLEEPSKEETSTSVQSSDDDKSIEKREPCVSTGKFLDPTSDGHYYVCYASQADPAKIESLRMSCPNDLIFCQERRVCTTHIRCYEH